MIYRPDERGADEGTAAVRSALRSGRARFSAYGAGLSARWLVPSNGPPQAFGAGSDSHDDLAAGHGGIDSPCEDGISAVARVDSPDGPDTGTSAMPDVEGSAGHDAGTSARARILLDPGRRGVVALAVIGVIAGLLAGTLAWRSRPRATVIPPVAVSVSGPVQLSGESQQNGAANDASPAVDRASQTASPPDTSGPDVVVSVGGRVKRPGLVRVPAGSRVADAIAAAGGAVPGTDLGLVNLARKLIDGELVLVGVTPPPGLSTQPGVQGSQSSGAGDGGETGAPINLNTATLDQLDGLPGVGPVLARRIVDYRDSHGGFTSVDQLREVDGIGDSKFSDLAGEVTV